MNETKTQKNISTNNKRVLDACCGSRMFWFDKKNPEALYIDRRKEEHYLCDGRKIAVNPDVQCDFTNMPFPDESFSLVVFDPPHMRAAAKSFMHAKYGSLESGWEENIKGGFSECFRVLKTNGTLIFKWNETHYPVSRILKLTDVRPLFGNRCGARSKTHWIAFIK